MTGAHAYPICMSEELIDLQSRISHLERTNEELSDIIADMSKRLVAAERKVAALMELAKDADQDGGQITFGETPPHY